MWVSGLPARPSRVWRRQAIYPHARRLGFSIVSRKLHPGLQRAKQPARWAVVEAPFALLEEQVDVGFWDAIVAAQMSLGLVPEVLDAVDVVGPGDKLLLVVNPLVVKLRYVKGIVGPVSVCIDDAIWLNAV